MNAADANIRLIIGRRWFLRALEWAVRGCPLVVAVAYRVAPRLLHWLIRRGVVYQVWRAPA